jgi:hypothetical protein
MANVTCNCNTKPECQTRDEVLDLVIEKLRAKQARWFDISIRVEPTFWNHKITTTEQLIQEIEELR